MGGWPRNLLLSSRGYQDCYRCPGSVYAAGKAFFSLFETFWRLQSFAALYDLWEVWQEGTGSFLIMGECEAAGTDSLHVVMTKGWATGTSRQNRVEIAVWMEDFGL